MLEESGIDYQFTYIKLSEQQQKQDWFLKLNPNGRIPVIVDEDNDNYAVFESGAILIYLAEKCGKFLPTDFRKRHEVIQWLMFQMGGIGPMQGQAHVFVRYAPEKIPFGIDRYQSETRRLYQVYDQRLADHEFLCGELSIADFAAFPWIRSHPWAKVSVDDMPNLQRWMQTLEERPAVYRGLCVPESIEINDLMMSQDDGEQEKNYVKGVRSNLMGNTD